MATPFDRAIWRLRRVAAGREVAGQTDADLWDRYARGRDESAFEALVRRHGPMVLGVCRRVLRNEQDAEDAFQATFLVLIRRGASLRSPGTLANWLHGVAYRTALETRGEASKRRAKEAATPPRVAASEDPWAELRLVLDQELGRLGEPYRAAVVLCDLEGMTRKDAARHLGWAEGTVASRLARGRSLLAGRLARRGYAGTLAGMAVAYASVPSALASATVAATRPTAAGGAPAGLLTHRVTTITEGVLKTMTRAKLRSAFAASALLGLAVIGTGGLMLMTATGAAGAGGDTPPARAGRGDRNERVTELKQELLKMQQKLADLEKDLQPKLTPDPAVGGELARRFGYRVPFETGYSENHEGGKLDIREVWGTRPRVEVGGQYLVRGKYALPRGQRGKIYFYVTSEGNWVQNATTLDLQTAEVDQPEGEFAVAHSLGGIGYFHVILTEREKYSRVFANVYFGTGDNVFRPKP